VMAALRNRAIGWVRKKHPGAVLLVLNCVSVSPRRATF
jgi:hypothetical protein